MCRAARSALASAGAVDHSYSGTAPPVLDTFAPAPGVPAPSLLEAGYQHLLDLAV